MANSAQTRGQRRHLPRAAAAVVQRVQASDSRPAVSTSCARLWNGGSGVAGGVGVDECGGQFGHGVGEGVGLGCV